MVLTQGPRSWAGSTRPRGPTASAAENVPTYPRGTIPEGTGDQPGLTSSICCHQDCLSQGLVPRKPVSSSSWSRALAVSPHVSCSSERHQAGLQKGLLFHLRQESHDLFWQNSLQKALLGQSPSV